MYEKMDMPDDCGGCFRQPPPLGSTVFGIRYATEMQTDFRELNWVNLLKLNFSQTLCNGILIDLGSISNTKTRPEQLDNVGRVFKYRKEQATERTSPYILYSSD